VPHYEKVTQIKADYPELLVPGGQNGVAYERKKGRHTGNQGQLPEGGQESKGAYS
jgi:hypothetical protein